MADGRNLEKVKELAAYRVSEEMYVEEMDSRAMVLEHIKSGARIFLMSNEDENKVFYIGFRTPPDDSTGLPHILEHSVLEGSDKFPVKDPFVELVKGSLNTFLNAMTYPDKTVYPVASCNDKDFQNLMDVYLDGVLHPAIYREPKIFLQEGWHYELESPEDELAINGVVYNEMKGAFSSPESVLDRFTRNVLFPDTTYSNESGGDPAVIPELTYEKFIAFHRNYYHPANSYIYLYGDMDMAQKLTWLDQEYLGQYDREDCHADSAIAVQQPFEQPVQREITYSVTEEEGTKDTFQDALGNGWQVVQSLLALGTGGLTGLGLGNSIQKNLYLPEAQNDFILAIIGEELGFIGVVCLMTVYLILIWRGCHIAINAPDFLGMMLAAGITIMIGVQVAINVAVVTSSMPPTGIILPFISFGGNALMIFMACIGILLNVSKKSSV